MSQLGRKCYFGKLTLMVSFLTFSEAVTSVAHAPLSINPILSETTLEFMLGQDEIFVRAKIQREFEYFDELNIIHNERSEF